MKLAKKGWSFFRREKIDAGMTGEIRHHFESQNEPNVKTRVNPDSAHRAAPRQFGNVASVHEDWCDQRDGVWFQQWFEDLSFAGGTLMKAPASPRSRASSASPTECRCLLKRFYSAISGGRYPPVAVKPKEECLQGCGRSSFPVEINSVKFCLR